MTKSVQFNVRKLRQPSQVLRKAAEIIQHDMLTRPAIDYDDPWYGGPEQIGGCAALDDVQDALYERLDPDYSYVAPQRVKASEAVLTRSRDLFREHFGYTNGGSARKGYWFGTQFTDKQQQHRIDALLMVAEIAEAQGE